HAVLCRAEVAVAQRMARSLVQAAAVSRALSPRPFRASSGSDLRDLFQALSRPPCEERREDQGNGRPEAVLGGAPQLVTVPSPSHLQTVLVPRGVRRARRRTKRCRYAHQLAVPMLARVTCTQLFRQSS